MHKHTWVSALLNTFIVVTTFAAWFAAIDGTITALNVASLLGALALGLMWVHYVADSIAPRNHTADDAKDYQYVVSRGVVLVAILLHPLLINWYLLDSGFGFPPASYEQLLGTAAWAVSLGWIALVAFLAFEIRKKLPKYRRHIFHANIAAMLLVFIHGFSVGLVLVTTWYAWVWWLLFISFAVVATLRYVRYYSGNNPTRLTIALVVVGLLTVVGGVSGVQTLEQSEQQGTVNEERVEDVSADQTTDSELDVELPGTAVTLEELATSDGLEGRDCWVAIDDTVYDATASPEWENGQHTSSDGAATCGNDLTSELSSSPHGRSVLSALPVVGQLK